MQYPLGTTVSSVAALRRLNASFPCSYTIFKDGTDYYAESNILDGTDYSNATFVANVLQNVFDQLTSGGSVYVKRGTYTLATTPKILPDTFLIAEPGTVFQLANNADCFLLACKNADSSLATNNVWIEGFTFEGNGSNQGANGQVHLTAIQNCTFIHNTIQNTRTTALYIQPVGDPETPTHGADYNLIAHNTFDTQVGSADLFIAGMRFSTIAYNYFTGTVGNYLLSCGAHSQGLHILHNTLATGGLTGIGCESSQRLWIEDNDISNMGTGHGIYIKKHASYNAPSNIFMKNNSVQNCGGAGIYSTDNTSNIDITGNHCFDNGDAGITIYNTQNFKILGNTVYDNNQDGNVAPDNAGIRISHAGSTGQVADNRLYDGGGATQDYGIYCQHASVIEIGDNYFNGNVTAPIGGVFTNIVTDCHARTATSVDLSGAAETLVALHAVKTAYLLRATLLYTEASGAGNCLLEIGKETDADYYYTGNSENAKAQWYTKSVTLLQNDVAAGDTILFSSAGGSGAAGEIMVILDYITGV